MKEGHFSQCPTRSFYAVAAIAGFLAVKDVTTGAEDYRANIAGASDGASCVGIAIGDADAGEAVGVALSGPGMAMADGSGTAIAAGDKLAPGAGGVLVKAAAGGWFIAEAREPLTAANLPIRVTIGKGQLNA